MIKEKTGPKRIARLVESMRTLGPKAQLQVLQEVGADLTMEDTRGVRYCVGSLSEYKRVTKAKAWDVPLTEWIDSFAASDIFFDIGSNIGMFSLLAGRRHDGRVRVFAFEPAADTFASLVRNIQLNGLGGVVAPFQVALSDVTAIETFNHYATGAGSALHVLGEAIDYAGRRFTPAAVQPVLAFSLDEFRERFGVPAPTRIKLDVDGGEEGVLAGASRTLSAGRCELWVELTDKAPDDPVPARITEMLARLGYSLAREVPHDTKETVYPLLRDALFVRK